MLSTAFTPEVIQVPRAGDAERGRCYAASGRPVYVQRKGLARTLLKYAMNSSARVFKSSVEVKLDRFRSRRARIENQISIWLSHEQWRGVYTKRMRWDASSRNFFRVFFDVFSVSN